MKQYSVTSLCRLLGVSTQAYYKHGDTAMRKLAEEAFCVEYIRRIRQKDRGIGGGKLWRMYRASFGEEHSVGYNRFYDIIDKYGLKVRRRPSVPMARRTNTPSATFLLSPTTTPRRL